MKSYLAYVTRNLSAQTTNFTTALLSTMKKKRHKLKRLQQYIMLIKDKNSKETYRQYEKHKNRQTIMHQEEEEKKSVLPYSSSALEKLKMAYYCLCMYSETAYFSYYWMH